MLGPQPLPKSAAAALGRTVEAFARDLMQLVRAARTYPPGHPFLLGAGERVLAGLPRDAAGQFSLGVARSELLVEGEFVGGAGSRAADLAALLVQRQVGRLTFSRAAELRDVLALADLLAARGAGAEGVPAGLQARGVAGVSAEPLHLDRIHAAASWGAAADGPSDEDRRRQAWLWLQSPDASPEEIARVLASDGLWQLGATEQDVDARACALLLAGLGSRLEQALGFLSDENRAAVLDRMADVGRSLTSDDLVGLVSSSEAGAPLKGMGPSALLRDLDPERFVELLAGLAALGDRGSRRLAGVFRRFAPPGGTKSALAVVHTRLMGGGGQRFALELWRSVEEFLLKLEEDPFMAQDYSEILEVAADEAELASEGEGEDLGEDCGRHLDAVHLGLAADGGQAWRQRLLDRLAERLGEGRAAAALSFANLADEALPGVLEDRPALVRELFRAGLGRAREAGPREVQDLMRFCRSHEAVVLGPALKALEQEQRIASRRLLVEILSGLSPAATPSLASRARAGPWFMARNLAIVLGRQGGGRAVPVLRELLEHRHPKVRREAERALALARGPRGREGDR